MEWKDRNEHLGIGKSKMQDVPRVVMNEKLAYVKLITDGQSNRVPTQ